MTKRDKNFRMAKETKRRLALLFPPLRGQYKNLMINAQIASQIVPKTDKKKREVEKED